MKPITILRYLTLTSLLYACGHVMNYKMPDGIICTVLDTRNGQDIFTGCSNGNTYINPTSYSVVHS